MTTRKPALWIALLLLLPVCLGAAEVQPAIRKLAAAEAAALEKRLDPRLLPAKSDQMEFQPDQAVALAGASTLRLMPVRFRSPGPGGTAAPHFQCGLFVAEGKRIRFIPTFGRDWTEAESCDGLNAIGLVNPAGAPETGTGGYPGIVLIYQAFTVPESFPEPVLLRWDAGTATYRPDAEQSQWLSRQKEGHTIPGARRLLAARSDGHPAS